MWLKELPKAELHCHLDGSIPVLTLKRFCRIKGIEIPEDKGAFYRRIQADATCASLTEYLEAFKIPLKCLIDEDSFSEAAYEIAMDAASENVRYLELRFAPLLSERPDFLAESIIEAVSEGLDSAYKASGIQSGILLCGMRNFSEKENQRTFELGKRYLGKGVCGLDLAGDESRFPNEMFVDYFKAAAKAGIPFTVHAGECGRSENIALAMEYGANRIGHGIAMRGNEQLQRKIREKGIGIELCPSSNLQTKAVGNWFEYPFQEFCTHEVKISVNTDNRTVTATSMTKELQALDRQFGLSAAKAAQLMYNAMDTSFAEGSIRKKIKREVREWEERCRYS